MKHLIKFTLLLLALLQPATASAFMEKVNGIYYNYDTYHGKHAIVTYNNYSDYSGDVIIPDYIQIWVNWYSDDGSYGEFQDFPVIYIGEHAFYNCDGLSSVFIPNSIISIGESAFSGCTSLTSVSIPYSVEYIGDDAFFNCGELTSIIVESGNKTYDSRDNCNAIIKTASNSLIRGSQNTSIPNSVITIERGAFSACRGLTSVTIPNSITSIGNNAFSGCCSLSRIVVECGNTEYDSRNGCNAIIETASNTLIVGCQNTIIPTSVRTIGDNAFYGSSNLASITIPNSVTSIGNSAFSGCI